MVDNTPNTGTETTVAAGTSSLQNFLDGTYQYNFKTQKPAPASPCFDAVLIFDGGLTLILSFRGGFNRRGICFPPTFSAAFSSRAESDPRNTRPSAAGNCHPGWLEWLLNRLLEYYASVTSLRLHSDLATARQSRNCHRAVLNQVGARRLSGNLFRVHDHHSGRRKG